MPNYYRAIRKSKPLFRILVTLSSLMLLIAACTQTTTEISPTAILEGTPTQSPSVTPTKLLTSTPEPTATPNPESVAKEAGIYVEGRHYAILEENQSKYLVDQYNQAKILKWESGGWVDTTLEEKYGHLAPKDGNYKVEIEKGADGISKFRINNAYWTGNYLKNSVKFDEQNTTVNTTVTVFVTRSKTGLLIEIDDEVADFFYPGMGLHVSVTGKELFSASHSLTDLLAVYAKHGVDLIGKPTVMTIFDSFIGKAGRRMGNNFYPTCSLDDNSGKGVVACQARLGLEMGKRGDIAFTNLFNALNGEESNSNAYTVYSVEGRVDMIGLIEPDVVDAIEKDLKAIE